MDWWCPRAPNVLLLGRKASTAHVWAGQSVSPTPSTQRWGLLVGWAGISRYSEDISAVLNAVEVFWQRSFEKVCQPKVMSTYYIPYLMESAFSSAFTLEGGAEFGNKIFYSMFAVTGDIAHLQSSVLYTPTRCKQTLVRARFKCLPIFAGSVLLTLCQCKTTLNSEIKSVGAYLMLYFSFAYHFFEWKVGTEKPLSTFLQVFI